MMYYILKNELVQTVNRMIPFRKFSPQTVNLFKPNGTSHSNQLDQSISVLRVVWW